MTYKISGTKSETARITVFKEKDWSIESDTVISGSGAYEVDNLGVGIKAIVAESNESEVLAFGNVAPAHHGVATKTLWTFGRNYRGQLGLGDTTSYSSPEQVGLLEDWSQVDGGYSD